LAGIDRTPTTVPLHKSLGVRALALPVKSGAFPFQDRTSPHVTILTLSSGLA
jgi:hypothetical protein